jgi:hypothetical protein
MSKSRVKQRQPAQLSPTIRLSGLRPRLDQLLRGETMAQGEPAVAAALEALTAGLKPAAFLPTVLAAYSAAPPMPQAQFAALLPGWIKRAGHTQALRGLVAQHVLAPELQQIALSLLEAGGEPVAELASELASWEPFYAAYAAGNEFQSSLMIFSYANPRRQRVHGLGFLIDLQPPWEGAVKDTMRLGQRPPEDAVAEYAALWDARGGEPLEQLDAAETTRGVLGALQQNRAQGIRLPGDLVAERALFQSDVLSLPDSPQTAAFTMDDFDELAREGRRPEAIMRVEQTLGYQTRTPDGQIIRVVRPDDDDF